MDIKPGDVVALKSGGQPITVAAVNDDMITCVWMGEEGDLFREQLPRVVLESISFEDNQDEDEDEDEQDEDEDEES